VIINAQINEREDQILTIEDEISALREFLPPVTSVCNLYFDCDSCSTNAKCGWCSATSQCIDGDSSGPINSVCTFYKYGTCNDAGCGTLNNCKSCLGNPLCGWCTDENLGYEVCIQQPANFTGCPSVGWFHLGGYQSACDIPGLDIFTLKAHVKKDNIGKVNPNNASVTPQVRSWMYSSIQNKILGKVAVSEKYQTKIRILKNKLDEVEALYEKVVERDAEVFDNSSAFYAPPVLNLTNITSFTVPQVQPPKKSIFLIARQLGK